jgi:DMSO/TMAO reductase YedYZ molybdopterin-dependent catalytic subunit
MGMAREFIKTTRAGQMPQPSPEMRICFWLQDITHYNNFYEFSTAKEGVAPAVAGFETKGWQVSVEGLVRKPKVFDIEDLLKISPPEEWMKQCTP